MGVFHRVCGRNFFKVNAGESKEVVLVRRQVSDCAITLQDQELVVYRLFQIQVQYLVITIEKGDMSEEITGLGKER